MILSGDGGGAGEWQDWICDFKDLCGGLKGGRGDCDCETISPNSTCSSSMRMVMKTHEYLMTTKCGQ